MASYLRPRRGKKTTAESQNIVLKRGEVFFESPPGGVGTGTGRIKVGDGTTAYTSLPYFLNPDNFISNISTANVTFTETTETNNTTLLSRIVTGAALNTIIASIKNLLSNLNSSVTTINNDIATKTDKLTNTDSFYGTCSTAAGTAAKVVTLVNTDNFSLRAGVTVTVKFSATNTAQNPTLNVNGSGAKSVWFGSALITTTPLGAVGTASRPTRYTYDGTYWVFMGWSYDNDTTYSAMSLQELKTGTATNQRTVQSSVLNPAIKMYCPHYATCTSQAANQKKTVVVADTNFQLYTGCIIAVKFDADNTYSPTAAAPAMFNVNLTGDKEVRGNSVNAATTGTTATNIFGRGNRIISYQYDGTYWVKIGQSWDDNNTYSPQSLGFGYGTCDTAAATAVKAVTLSGYALVNNGIVSVKFTYDVPASATMNINSKGAKSIYYHGAAITAGIIKAGDIATFMYYNNIYHLISLDSDHPIEITWDAWNALSSAQRAGKHYIITDVPDATGSLDCDLMDLLWKNSNPTAAFGAQDISLNLTGYDFVVIFTSMGNDEQFTAISRVPKSGETDVWSKVLNVYNSGTTNYVMRREYRIYTNKIHFDNGIDSAGNASSALHIPYEIYGIKKSVSFDFSAIAHDVSTVLFKDIVINLYPGYSGSTIAVSTGISPNKILSICPFYTDDLYYLIHSDGLTGFVYATDANGEAVLVAPQGKILGDVAAKRTLNFRVAYLI